MVCINHKDRTQDETSCWQDENGFKIVTRQKSWKSLLEIALLTIERKKERKKEKDVYLLFDIAVKNESEAITFARERERESGN